MDVVVKRGGHDSPASKRVNYGAFLRGKDAYGRICFSKSKQKFDTVKGGKNIPNEVLDLFFFYWHSQKNQTKVYLSAPTSFTSPVYNRAPLVKAVM